MSHGLTRAERLRELERLYAQPGHGYTDIELAQRFDVDRTVIYRDRQLLETDDVPLIETERGRYTVDRERYLSNIRVNLNEALVLYLAARRLSRHTRTAQKHVVSALEKLALALQKPMTERLVKTATHVWEQAPAADEGTILETLARSWAEQIKVRIRYRALGSEKTHAHIVAPYLLEPSIWSDGAYVVGRSDGYPELIPFKVERIEKATLTTERYEIDDTFDEETLFRYAWGIWRSKEEPETVKLRFIGKRAIQRMQESIWHSTQEEPVEQDDGSYVWTAQIAEWREMLPWVRSWGVDVEVLEPEELRETLRADARRLARRYGWEVHRPRKGGSTETYDEQRFRDIFGD